MLLKKILIALAATLIIVYFYPHPEANRYNYEEGRPWNYSKLIAPFDIPVHPDSATSLRPATRSVHVSCPYSSSISSLSTPL